MKGTNRFKQVIKQYLDNRAKEDELFAAKYANPKKNLDDCVQYILSEVKKSGKCGFADDEIYGMAVHYYDEEEIKVGKAGECQVVINHAVELTDAEKQKARKEAIEVYKKEQLAALKAEKEKKQEAKPKQTQQESQLDLFSMLSDEA